MNARKIFIKYFDLIRTVAAILIGFALTLVLLFFVSKDPLNAVRSFMLGPFSSPRRFFNIIELMIPLTFTALGMCLMLQVGEFNLLGEGIFGLAGAFTAYFACKLLPASIPPVVFPALLILFGAVLGALMAAIPALLRIKWNANIVVITIMLNYVLVFFATYMLRYWMRDTKVTYLGSYKFAENAKLTTLIRGTKLHTGVWIAAAAVLVVWWFLFRTTKGYEIRLTGHNQSFAKYVGINVVGSMLAAQMLGGALAGMGGAVEILGRYDRFLWMEQTGYGFDGMMIAVIAKKNPALVPLAAFFMAYLKTGANISGATTDVPLEFIKVIQSIIIILVAATMFMDSLHRRAVIKASTEETGVA